MLGGASITDGLRRSAREMLGERSATKGPPVQAAAGESKSKGESERAKAKGANTKDTEGTKDTKAGKAKGR